MRKLNAHFSNFGRQATSFIQFLRSLFNGGEEEPVEWIGPSGKPWDLIVVRALIGEKAPGWFVELFRSRWRLPLILAALAMLAGAVSFFAGTHAVTLPLQLTFTKARDLGSIPPITYTIAAGYWVEPNFLPWLLVFLPLLWLVLVSSLRETAEALARFSNRQKPLLRMASERALAVALNPWPLRWQKTRRLPFFVLWSAAILVPVASYLFQEPAMLDSVSLPRLPLQEFIKNFDYGNTQAPMLGAIVERFNMMPEEVDRYHALKERREDMLLLSQVIRKALPETSAAPIIKEYFTEDGFDFEKATAAKLISLKLQRWPEDKVYAQTSAKVAYAFYRLLTYTLVGFAWWVALFALYILVAQFLCWYRLIRCACRGARFRLNYLYFQRNFALGPVQKAVAYLYGATLIGASYVLFQCTAPTRLADIKTRLQDGGLGGSFQLRVVNMVFVGAATGILLIGVIAIYCLTLRLGMSKVNGRYQRKVDNAKTPGERDTAKNEQNLAKSQRFVRMNIGMLKILVMTLAFLALPIFTISNQKAYQTWSTVRYYYRWWVIHDLCRRPFHTVDNEDVDPSNMFTTK
jgi:hypothetical protein